MDFKKYAVDNFFINGEFKRNSNRGVKHKAFFDLLKTHLGKKTDSRSELLFILFNTADTADSIGKCLVCKLPTKFTNIHVGYTNYCSTTCMHNDAELSFRRHENSKKGMIKKYGVSNPMLCDSIKNKVSSTIKSRYGKSWYVETEPFKNASVSTNLERYGYTNPQQSPSLKEEIRRIISEKYSRKSPRNFTSNRTQQLEKIKCQASELNIELDTSDFDIHTNLTDQSITYSHACGHTWSAPTSELPACPICHRGSKSETELKEFILSLGVDAKFNDRKMIAPLELDVFIPSKMIAIEMNGLYWHHDDSGRTSIKCKTDICENIGIQLISIWEHEWNNIDCRNKIKNSIRVKLGMGKKIAARTLSLYVPTAKEEKDFLDAHHIQKSVKSTWRIALVDRHNNIIMLMTAGKCRFGSSHELELLRLCSKDDTIVMGGFAKMIKVLRRKHPAKTIISFCDRRFNNGRGYVAQGFALNGSAKPNYLWWKHKTFLSRYATMKHLLPKLLGNENYSDLLSESENMKANGWRKISDAGNLRFDLVL